LLGEGYLLSTELRYTLDGIDLQSMIVATYFLELDGGADIIARIRQVSSLIYPGAWTETSGEAQHGWEKHAARILGIYETPPYEIQLQSGVPNRRFIFQIAVPLVDLGESLASLLTFVGGEILAYGNLKLLDLYLPESYTRRFHGPQFGVEGLRQLLNAPERPLVLAILKPSQGYSPQEGASIFFEAARGGVDIIKDEELLFDPAYCRRAERVRLYMAAEKRAFEETGEHTLYAVNITDPADRLIPNALEAIELGANALMVNYMQVGLDMARTLCEDSRVSVPVLGHNSGATSVFASTHTGMSAPLANGKIPRLCGMDMGIVLSGRGGFPALPERVLLLVRELLTPLHAIRPTLPVIANGITPGLAHAVVRAYGRDVALGAGSAIFGHPQGPAAGARAFRQAIQAVVDGRDVQAAAEEHRELGEALRLWGSGE